MSEDEQGQNPRDDDRENGKPSDGGEESSHEPGAGGRSGDDGKSDEKGDDKKENKPSLFQRPLFWIILICVAAVIVVSSLLYYLHARQYESTDDAFVDTHIVRIASQVSGQLTEVSNLDNRHVQTGQLLAVIEPIQPQAQLAEADAGVVQAQAQYQQALAQVAAAQAANAQAIDQSQAPLATAQKAAQDLARYEALKKLDPTAVAGQQLDQARSQAQSTAAEAEAARRQIGNTSAQIAVAERNAKAAQAGINAKKAVVDQAKVTLGYSRITAPVNGQVVNRQVNLGSYVSPGAQLMAVVPDHMWVTANFKETQLAHMKIGQPVAIKVDAFPDIQFQGRVDSVQRGAGQAFALLPPQNATGNYVKVVQRVPVRIEFVTGKDGDGKPIPDPRQYPIGPGMSVVPTVTVR
jgi:membrane fusion protein, multidrug efflux system